MDSIRVTSEAWVNGLFPLIGQSDDGLNISIFVKSIRVFAILMKVRLIGLINWHC